MYANISIQPKKTPKVRYTFLPPDCLFDLGFESPSELSMIGWASISYPLILWCLWHVRVDTIHVDMDRNFEKKSAFPKFLENTGCGCFSEKAQRNNIGASSFLGISTCRLWIIWKSSLKKRGGWLVQIWFPYLFFVTLVKLGVIQVDLNPENSLPFGEFSNLAVEGWRGLGSTTVWVSMEILETDIFQNLYWCMIHDALWCFMLATSTEENKNMADGYNLHRKKSSAILSAAT